MNMTTIVIICVVGFIVALTIPFLVMKKKNNDVAEPTNVQIIEEITKEVE